MRNGFTRVIAALALAAAAGGAIAADGDGGYAGAHFQIPIGARPAGMGGAFVAVAEGGASPLYNPAGMAGAPKKLFATSYRAMDLDRKLGYATFLMPTRERSAVGFTWLYFGSGSVETRTSEGKPTGGELSLNSHAFSALFAKAFEEYFALGVRASYLHSTFAEMKAFSVGIDAGAMFNVTNMFDRERRAQMAVQDIRVGVVIKNLAAKYRWNSGDYYAETGSDAPGVEQEDAIPVEAVLGVSARFFERRLLAAADLYKNVEQDPRFYGGAEFLVTPEFSIRSGLSAGRFTAGTGYIFKFKNQLLMIDYAFATDRVDEGSEHIFSFDVMF